jgi:hypothetical protein
LNFIMNVSCVVISFTITVISTVQDYMYTKTRQDGFNSTLLETNQTTPHTNSRDSNLVLHYLVVVLPVLLSVLSALHKNLYYCPKISAFTYAAAAIDSELHRYKTKTGVYSDSMANSRSKAMLRLDARRDCRKSLYR